MDYLAGEGHFLDHLMPIWRALPGTFYVESTITDHATRRGIAVSPVRIPASLRPTQRDPTPILVASYGDIKKARRMGRTNIAFIEHGIGQSYNGAPGRAAHHGSYAGGADRDDVGLFLMPNEHSAGQFRARYPAARIEIIGSPHAEHLPRRVPGPGPVVAISFHWNCHIAPETLPAWGHFKSVLPALPKHWKMLGHAHPRAWAGLSRYYRRFGIEPVEDFTEVCRRADVYVCDNSSSLYEFAATGRPVVVLNAPHYRRNVEHGLRFWEAATVGVQSDMPYTLVAAIRRALEQRPEDVAAREAALDIVYGHRSGATARAVAALREWSGEGAEVAA